MSLTAVAAAQPPTDDYVAEQNEPAAFNMFGFRMTTGVLSSERDRSSIVSVGLGVEHPVFQRTRVFGEYEWLWLTRVDERDLSSMVARPERHATGQRASLGLRRELIATKLTGSARLFIDGELGAGVDLVNDNMTGVALLADVVGGLRFGFDIYSSSDDAPSRTFEAELVVRAIAIPGGMGVTTGVGMLWGN
jgi:hypothetical protein